MITVWLDYKSQLHQIYELPMVKDCYTETIAKVFLKYEWKTNAKVVAIKCENAENFILENRVMVETRKKNIEYFYD